MAFYGRRYRRYRRYKRFYRRFGRYGRRSYSRRYVNASSRSNVRVKASIEANLTLSSGTSAAPGAVTTVSPFVPSDYPGSALKSPLYRTYCSLYEEVKCVGFKSQVSVASVIGGADIPSLQIYTGFDRRHGANEGSWTAQQIKDSSSYLVATALNNNVAKLTRSIYAGDLMEKAQWHDCSLELAGGVYSDTAYTAAAGNPNFFCPAMFMCFQAPTLAAAVDVKVNISTVFYFAFRNPKYGAGASAAKLESLGGVLHPGPGDDGNMDDGGAAPAAAAAAAAAIEDDISDVEMDGAGDLEARPLRVSRVRRPRDHAVARLRAGPLVAGENRDRGGKNV